VTRVGVLGTGVVGRTLARRLAEVGHDVLIGSRAPQDDEGHIRIVTFAEAAEYGEVVVNATSGLVSIEALTLAGYPNLAGKPLADVSNSLDVSGGYPPRILSDDSTSVAEQIQAEFPDALVVKTLNTMNADVMVDPTSLRGPSTVFVAGNDDEAKAAVRSLLADLGWGADQVLDLGDLTAARGLEMYVALWLRIYASVGPTFNIDVVRG
jgi:predicted dinucleotide-binding enzyme